MPDFKMPLYQWIFRSGKSDFIFNCDIKMTTTKECATWIHITFQTTVAEKIILNTDEPFWSLHYLHSKATGGKGASWKGTILEQTQETISKSKSKWTAESKDRREGKRDMQANWFIQSFFHSCNLHTYSLETEVTKMRQETAPVYAITVVSWMNGSLAIVHNSFRWHTQSRHSGYALNNELPVRLSPTWQLDHLTCMYQLNDS